MRQTAGQGATILHISDTQFGQYHRFDIDSADSLSGHLVRDLDSLSGLGVPPIDVIVLSGDIAEAGMQPEYVDALAFIDALCQHTGLGYERVVVVPGNHDVTWPLSEAYFAECRAFGKPAQPPYAKKWLFYQDLVTQLHGPTGFTEEQPYRLHRFDDLRLVVAAMNSTIRESHRDADHYGWCGTEQLRWFQGQLAATTGMLRIGVVHHNARRRAQADNENLRDEDVLSNILRGHLDLLLHGHTHEGTEDRLPNGTLVLATGSAAVTPDRRPDEVPNQYQVLRVAPDGLTRWARQWDGRHRWMADPRASPDGNATKVWIRLDVPGWRQHDEPDTEPDTDPDRRHSGRLGLPFDVDGRGEDMAAEVERVTRWDLGQDAVIERRSKQDPTLVYLLADRPAAPLRCVGIVTGRLDSSTLDSLEERVFAPLRGRDRGRVELIVVHRGPDDPRLRQDALRQGIHVKTLTEYHALLELGAYRTWLLADLEADTLYPQKLYQPQRFRDVDRLRGVSGPVREDLLSEVYDTMLDDTGRFVLVLGDAGFGKSFLVRRLAYLMLGNERVNLTPLVIYLRDRDKRQTIDEMVASVLIPSRTSFDADRFQHSLEAGTLALLVDGYDEFAVRVGYENAAAQLHTFLQAMRGRAKVLLTTRPNHFRSTNQVTSRLFDSLRTVHQGRVFQLEPFDADQQRAFLTRWFELYGGSGRPEPARPAELTGQWMAALAQVDNLPELARTPRMLSFMVEDLALTEIQQAARQGTVTAADLYQRLVERWLVVEESKVDPDDERRVDRELRQRVLEELALHLWRVGERDVTEDALHRTAREMLPLPKLELTLDQAAQVIGGRTLLQVDESRWRFAHQSVWEFLLAKRIAALLRAGGEDQLLGEAQLTGLTIRFLRDLAPEEAAAWVARTAGGQP